MNFLLLNIIQPPWYRMWHTELNKTDCIEGGDPKSGRGRRTSCFIHIRNTTKEAASAREDYTDPEVQRRFMNVVIVLLTFKIFTREQENGQEKLWGTFKKWPMNLPKKCIIKLEITFVSIEFMSAFLFVVKNVCFSMDHVRLVCLSICLFGWFASSHPSAFLSASICLF